MRKISKSRADDDVVSSTNGSGSLGNDDQQDADQSGEQDENKSATKENDGNGDESDTSKDNLSSYKSKSRKRKAGKNKNDDDYDESKLKDINHSDEESEVSKEASKKTPKGKAKAKPKKGKSGREIKKNVEEEYEVERIVGSKRIKGKLHYLIRWKGYTADSDSWEPHDTLSCPDVINKYNEEKETPPTKSNKRKSKKKESKVPVKRAKTSWDSQNADENAEYEVERILEVHHKKSGEREFLIHWKGWSNKFDSWEPEQNLNCPDLIKRFMDKVSAARSKEGRSLRVAPETTHRFTLQAPSSGRRLSKRRGQTQRVRYDNAE